MDFLEGVPYRSPHPAFRLVRGYLELDLEEVERVHAQHRDDACTESGERMVLGRKGEMSESPLRVEAQREDARWPRWGRSSAEVGWVGPCPPALSARRQRRSRKRADSDEHRQDGVGEIARKLC